MERQISKKPQKLDKFPPCPLNNPYSYLNSYVIYCRPGPLLSRYVSQFQIWRGVLLKYAPPQSSRFGWKWGSCLGGWCPATPQGSPSLWHTLASAWPGLQNAAQQLFLAHSISQQLSAKQLNGKRQKFGSTLGWLLPAPGGNIKISTPVAYVRATLVTETASENFLAVTRFQISFAPISP